jgi:hypothetical protein
MRRPRRENSSTPNSRSSALTWVVTVTAVNEPPRATAWKERSWVGLIWRSFTYEDAAACVLVILALVAADLISSNSGDDPAARRWRPVRATSWNEWTRVHMVGTVRK